MSSAADRRALTALESDRPHILLHEELRDEELRAANREIAALKERASDDGERFSLNDSSKEIARVLAGPGGWSRRKFREIIDFYEATMAEHEKQNCEGEGRQQGHGGDMVTYLWMAIAIQVGARTWRIC